MAVEALLEGDAEAIAAKCIELALNGDPTALRLVMERVAPVRRGRPVRFSLPSVETVDGLVSAMGAILSEVAAGQITLEEGQLLAGLLENTRRMLEIVEFERRLTALEESQIQAVG